jgi:protein-disulfide isomerase
MENNAPTQQNNMAIPIAIVIAGALIAASLYFVSTNPQAGGIQLPTAGTNAPERQDIAGVQPDDHIRGNPEAPLVIVEFSDPECPFCARFHTTMQEAMDEFGDSGQIAWVYRNFPLTSLHQKAVPESIALECAAELGGNDGFWAYTDMLYAETPSNDGLPLSQLPVFAEAVGLDATAFNECLTDPLMEERVQADFEEAVASGGQGTPYNVLLYKGQQIPVEGGIPYQDYNGNPGMKSIIEQVLAQ